MRQLIMRLAVFTKSQITESFVFSEASLYINMKMSEVSCMPSTDPLGKISREMWHGMHIAESLLL